MMVTSAQISGRIHARRLAINDYFFIQLRLPISLDYHTHTHLYEQMNVDQLSRSV